MSRNTAGNFNSAQKQINPAAPPLPAAPALGTYSGDAMIQLLGINNTSLAPGMPKAPFWVLKSVPNRFIKVPVKGRPGAFLEATLNVCGQNTMREMYDLVVSQDRQGKVVARLRPKSI
jgi:hypothetical protein